MNLKKLNVKAKISLTLLSSRVLLGSGAAYMRSSRYNCVVPSSQKLFYLGSKNHWLLDKFDISRYIVIMMPLVFGGFGPHRFFERGHIKLVILDLIYQQPRHGYDIIQELEGKSHGLYSPSAGTIYPILQLLEDQGFIASDQQEGKRVYSITKDGEKHLKEYKEQVDHLKNRDNNFEERFGPYAQDIFKEVKEIAPLIFKNVKKGSLKDYEKAKELRSALRDFRKKIEKIFPEG